MLLRVDVCFLCVKTAEDLRQKITAKMEIFSVHRNGLSCFNLKSITIIKSQY